MTEDDKIRWVERVSSLLPLSIRDAGGLDLEPGKEYSIIGITFLRKKGILRCHVVERGSETGRWMEVSSLDIEENI